MDVSLPIASVIPSLDGPVLGALAATRAPLRLTEVHRLAGHGSLTGVRKVLRRLVSMGLVHEVPGGFVLNRDHLAAPEVEALAGLHGRLLQRLRTALEAWDGTVRLAGVFGSAARRDGDAESDIDVLVVSDSEGLDDLTDALSTQIRQWTGNRAQVVGLSTAELQRLRKAKEPVVASWERDLVVLVGDRRLLAAAA